MDITSSSEAAQKKAAPESEIIHGSEITIPINETKSDEPEATENTLPIIEIRGKYFLGHCDRSMTTGLYGHGNYLWFDDQMIYVKMHDAQKRMVINNSGQIYTLISEPDMELFMYHMGKPWDTCYKYIWKGTEDYVDYIPAIYMSFRAFAKKKFAIYNFNPVA